MSYLIQEATLTELADAVRELAGNELTYTPAEMAALLREVYATKPWTRPDGWPDYDGCIKRVGQTDVLYLTCMPEEDNSTVVFQITTVDGGQYQVEKGSVDSDGFTASETTLVDSGTSYSEDLGSDDEYVVFRLTAPDDALYSFNFGTTSAATSYPVVEIWGQVENLSVPAYGLSGSELKSVDILADSAAVAARAFRSCGAEYINVRRWNIAPTTLQHMFYQCTNLATLDPSGWDTSSVKDMSQLFYHCLSLTELDLSAWETGSATTLYYSFSGCTGMTSLNLGGWDISNVTTMSGAFSGCSALVDFTPPKMYISFSLSSSSLLSDDSIQAVIDCLQEVDEIQTLTLHSTVKAKLTDEQIETAEAKGWTIA